MSKQMEPGKATSDTVTPAFGVTTEEVKNELALLVDDPASYIVNKTIWALRGMEIRDMEASSAYIAGLELLWKALERTQPPPANDGRVRRVNLTPRESPGITQEAIDKAIERLLEKEPSLLNK
jgi:hypothetical protein